MPIISITIPQAKLQKAIDALCTFGNYKATIDGQPNPETQSLFAKRMIAEFVQKKMQDKQRSDLLLIAGNASLDDVSDII